MSTAAEVLDQLKDAPSASEQLKILQRAWGVAGAVELSLEEADAILQKLGQGKSRAQQLELVDRCREERAAVSAFDVAVSALIAPMNLVRHLEKVLLSARIAKTPPTGVARHLDQLEERCFLSAAQASQLLRAIAALLDPSKPRDAELSREYVHVVCSRVLDRWNLTEADHTEVCCYYGWDAPYVVRLLKQAMAAAPDGEARGASAAVVQARVLEEQSRGAVDAPPLYSRLLQNRVLAHMGRADHTVYAHSWNVRSFAATVVARNLAAGASGGEPDACAVCLEPVHAGTALWTCAVCKNVLHAECRREWERTRRKRRRRDGDGDGARGGGEEDSDDGFGVPCPYCRAVRR